MLAIVRLENKIKITIALALRRATHRPEGEQRPGRIEKSAAGRVTAPSEPERAVTNPVKRTRDKCKIFHSLRDGFGSRECSGNQAARYSYLGR